MTLDERLENWGRAWRDNRSRPDLCHSLEVWYRSPRGVEVEYETGDPPPRWRPRPNLTDALAVELAVCSLDVYDHALLRAWYVLRAPPWVCLKHARKAANWQRGTGLARSYPRRRISDFEPSLALAKAALVAQLALPAVVHKRRAVLWVRQVLAVGPICV